MDRARQEQHRAFGLQQAGRRFRWRI